MGYTLYWRQSRHFTDLEWSLIANFLDKLVREDAENEDEPQVICDAFGQEREPNIRVGIISFNGNEKYRLDAEPFVLTKCPRRDYLGIKQYCKTYERPYGLVAFFLLKVAKAVAPDAIEIMSDCHLLNEYNQEQDNNPIGA